MIQDILEQKLSDADLVVPGQSLFRSSMPADVRHGVMTRIPLEGLKEDPDVPSWFKGRIQVITRHFDPVLGNSLAMRVQKSLTARGREVFPATSERGEVAISFFIPETLPIEFPRLEGNGIEWSQHFKVAFFGET